MHNTCRHRQQRQVNVTWRIGGKMATIHNKCHGNMPIETIKTIVPPEMLLLELKEEEEEEEEGISKTKDLMEAKQRKANQHSYKKAVVVPSRK